VAHAFDYVKGLVTCPDKRTLTKISDNCSEKNNQAFSHFLSQSPWDHRALQKWVLDFAYRIIGKNGALVIDECGNLKAGSKSVGVGRQFCGNVGKVDNCQVAVFLAYVKQCSWLSRHRYSWIRGKASAHLLFLTSINN